MPPEMGNYSRAVLAIEALEYRIMTLKQRVWDHAISLERLEPCVNAAVHDWLDKYVLNFPLPAQSPDAQPTKET